MGKIKTVTLNDGIEIPIFAFGTGTSRLCLHGKNAGLHRSCTKVAGRVTEVAVGTAQAWTDCEPVVRQALQLGSKHLDCAWHYKNQIYTGRAVRASAIPREEVSRIQTKEPRHGGMKAPKSVQAGRDCFAVMELMPAVAVHHNERGRL